MKNIALISLLIFLASCTNTAVQEELEKTKNELNAAKANIEKLKAQIEPEGKLVHLVLLKINPTADLAVVGNEMNKLKKITAVKDLQFGSFEDLGDKRALSEYNFMMEMSFDDEAAYQEYQKHPIHITFKEIVTPFLTAPPVTYDYLKK